MNFHEHVWQLALQEAKAAFEKGEVPVGAVIVKDRQIIASAHNLSEHGKNPLLHAERLAIEKALDELHSMYLYGCDLYVTLEPCCMCAGAIDLVGIKRVYFGAYDPKMGEVDHNHQVWQGKNIEAYGGFYAQQSGALLREFFQRLR